MPDFSELFATNWGFALAISAGFLSMTKFALGLLAPTRKEDLSLWLLGAREENWSVSFCNMFDAVFGSDHLSLKCFLRSALASVIAVTALWLAMAAGGLFQRRLGEVMEFWQVLLIASAINILADYASLFETRWLLGRLHQFNSVMSHLAVLVVDLILSAAIILIVIYFYQLTPLHDGNEVIFAEILGGFSIFALFFYSTFLTSIWTWGYILSTWFMRLFTQLGLNKLLDVEKRPDLMIAVVGAVCLFGGSFAVALPFQKGPGGLSPFDSAMCTVFKGHICRLIAGTIDDPPVQSALMARGCEGIHAPECVVEGNATWDDEPERSASHYEGACSNGEPAGCSNLAMLLLDGRGIAQDVPRALRLFSEACEDAYGRACNELGDIHWNGEHIEKDLNAALDFFVRGCERSLGLACANVGYFLEKGLTSPADLAKATEWYELACSLKNGYGCWFIANLSMEDEKLEQAESYFSRGCNFGEGRSCYSLYYHARHDGLPVNEDYDQIATLRQGCAVSSWQSCAVLGRLLIEVEPYSQALDNEALSAVLVGCANDHRESCVNAARIYRNKGSANYDLEKAEEFRQRACTLDGHTQCVETSSFDI